MVTAVQDTRQVTSGLETFIHVTWNHSRQEEYCIQFSPSISGLLSMVVFEQGSSLMWPQPQQCHRHHTHGFNALRCKPMGRWRSFDFNAKWLFTLCCSFLQLFLQQRHIRARDQVAAAAEERRGRRRSSYHSLLMISNFGPEGEGGGDHVAIF